MKTTMMLTMAVLALAGCGGDRDDPPVAVDDRSVPAGATATPAAWADYVGSRPVEDTLEPLVVQGLVPPVSDDEEPAPLR